MTDIQCPHRVFGDGSPSCEIVQQLVDLPLAMCKVNDSACQHCLGLSIAPQAPNCVTASMSIHAARRTGDTAFEAEVFRRMRPHLTKVEPAPFKTPAQVPCILRGKVKRQAECRPCQANGQLMVDVFTCPKHRECTINNTGLQPKIKGCVTCQERVPESYQIDVRPTPPEVLQHIQNAKHKTPT